eukprot:47839-Eustigmatos_ZCMA.PRE.1
MLRQSWEWCLAHMLHNAVREAFGQEEDAAKVKNRIARGLIGLVRKMIESINKSQRKKIGLADLEMDVFDTSYKLVNACPTRWTSLVKVLERVLKVWKPLTQLYDKDEVVEEQDSKFPLKGRRRVFLELYSILRAVSDVIMEVQCKGHCTAVTGLFKLICLRTSDFAQLPIRMTSKDANGQPVHREVQQTLEILDPASEAAPIRRLHRELTPEARYTLKTFVYATDWRWFAPRYGKPAWGTLPPAQSYLFDCGMYFVPAWRKLDYIKTIVYQLGGTDGEYTQ